MIELTISSLLLAAVRDLCDTRNILLEARLKGVRSDIEEMVAQPNWFARLTCDTDGSSDFAIRVALRIVRPASLGHFETWDKTKNDAARIGEIAGKIDTFIKSHIQPDTPLFISSQKRGRSAITKLLVNLLLSDRLDHAVNRYDSTFDPQIPSTDVTNRSTATRIRERHAATLQQLREDEEWMIRSTNLDLAEVELRRLVQGMEKVVGFNLRVFGDLYAGPGMLVGS